MKISRKPRVRRPCNDWTRLMRMSFDLLSDCRPFTIHFKPKKELAE